MVGQRKSLMDEKTFFFLLFGLIGLTSFASFLRELWLAIRSRHWNLFDCDIIDCQVEKRRGWRITSFVPIISYEYTFDGVRYEGNKIRYGGTWDSESNSRDYCEKYSVGRIVKVSVDPIHPKRSVLVPGVSLFLIWEIIFSIVIGTWGFAALILYSPIHH